MTEYAGWTISFHATTPEHFGWTEVLDPGTPPDPERPRKFVKINGGPFDWIWYPQDFALASLAYSCGASDGHMANVDQVALSMEAA